MRPRATEQHIGWGDGGIADTLRVMRRLAYEGTADAGMIEWAHDAVRSVPARDTDGEASAILNAFRSRFRYTHDPVRRELVKSPGVMAREIREKGVLIEDCDGAVTFLLCALEIVGIVAEPVVVSRDAGTYSHVLVRYQSPSRGWVTLDGITRNAPGWFPPDMQRAASFSGGSLHPISPSSGGAGMVKFGGAQSVVRAPVTAAPVRGRPLVPVPAAASPYPAMAGCDCKGDGPVNTLAKASKALSPYTDLMWWAWAAASVWAFKRTERRRR